MSPLISILIPAYNYPEGLERILLALQTNVHDIEVVIFDDSLSPEVERVVKKFSTDIPNIVYRRNYNTYEGVLGAVRNWNSLLDAARGKYIVLMHHDEFPMDSRFIPNLLEIIGNSSAPDIVLFDLVLVDESLKRLPPHFPNCLREIAIRLMPSYLFRRNIIGPTGTLAIRRSITPRFDLQLRWLVDVDFYFQLSKAGLKWLRAANIKVVSVQRMKGTITKELSGKLSEINFEERNILAMRYSKNQIWIRSDASKLATYIELIFWVVLRVLVVISYRLLKCIRIRSF